MSEAAENVREEIVTYIRTENRCRYTLEQFDKALVEARKEGKQLRDWDKEVWLKRRDLNKRREAFEEAARACDEHAETMRPEAYMHEREIWCAEGLAVDIRALSDRPPPDTGWRARVPTDAEVDQHDGLWALDYGQIRCWIYDIQWSQDTRLEDMKRIRPVSKDLMPAPWPESP